MSKIHKVFPDARPLTDRERQNLCKLVYRVLVQIRNLGWSKKPEQAAALADAFHNLPVMLWSGDFSLNYFRNFLEEYHREFPDDEDSNYLKMLERIFDEE